MSAAILAFIAVQAEATFAGNGTGTIHELAGLTEFEQQFESLARTTRISVWRQEASQQSAGASYRGRLDIEVAVSPALNLLLQTILALKSSGSVAGGTEYVYRMARVEELELPSVKLLVAFEDGPWLTFSGVMITMLRFTVRALQVVRLSVDWVAASKVETDVNPGWTIVRTECETLVGFRAVAEIDETAVETLIELGLTIEVPLELRNLTTVGVAGMFAKNGPATVGGNLVDYLGGSDLPAKVRSGVEFDLGCVLSDGTIDRLAMELPRTVAQSGQPAIKGDSDVTTPVPYKVLLDAAADPNDEPLLTLVVH